MKVGNKRRLSFNKTPAPSNKGRRLPHSQSQPCRNAAEANNLPNIAQRSGDGSINQTRDEDEPITQQDIELTGLMPGDLRAMTSIMTEVENRIIRNVNGTQNKLLLQMKQNEAMVSELAKAVTKVESSVSLLKTVTMQNTAALGRTHTSGKLASKSKNKNGKTTFEEDVEALHPTINIELRAVFSSEMTCRAAAVTLSSIMEYFHDTQDDIRMTARVFAIVSYGLAREKTMSEFKYGTGKHHATFRFKIVKNIVKEALLLTDGSFRAQEQEVITDLVRGGACDLELSAGKPSWLAPHVLTSRIIRMARKQHDCVKSERDPIPNSAKERRALYACRYVFKIVLDMLRRARDRFRQKMFGAGMLLLADWKKVRFFQEGHCNPVFTFLNPEGSPISPKDVRDTMTVSEHRHELDNARYLKELIASRDEMVVQATYNVIVVVPRRGRNLEEDTEDEIREITRQLNILRIALSFVQTFTQCPEHVVLSAHPSMLRNVYRIALIIREFFIDHLDEDVRPSRATFETAGRRACNNGDLSNSSRQRGGANERDSSQDTGNGSHGDISRLLSVPNVEVVIPTIQVKDLLPSKSEIEKELMKILKISQDTFNKLNVRYTGNDDLEQDGGIVADEGVDSGHEEDETGMFGV